MEQYHGTTIVSVRRGNKVVVGGDGQVSQGNTVMKGNARKVRRLHQDRVIAGFAGGHDDRRGSLGFFGGQRHAQHDGPVPPVQSQLRAGRDRKSVV